MNIQTVKYELCDFRDPAYELNTSTFALKSGNAQYKDE